LRGKKPSSKPKLPKNSRSKSREGEAAGKMECLCLECGISNYLPLEELISEDFEPSEVEILAHRFCSNCGGPLLVRGKAGDEPYYSTR
jgi:hypothetical protein